MKLNKKQKSFFIPNIYNLGISIVNKQNKIFKQIKKDDFMGYDEIIIKSRFEQFDFIKEKIDILSINILKDSEPLDLISDLYRLLVYIIDNSYNIIYKEISSDSLLYKELEECYSLKNDLAENYLTFVKSIKSSV